MARARFSGRGGLPAPKRQIANSVIDTLISALTTVAGTVKVGGALGFELLEPAATIVRTRGELVLGMATALDARMHGAFGLINVSADATAVGITALPGPLTDGELDWHVWVPLNLWSVDAAEDAAGILQNRIIPFDSRGMRKIKSGSTVVGILEIVSDTAGVVIDGSFSAREQLKL